MPSNFERMGMPLDQRRRIRSYVCLPVRFALTLAASLLLVKYPTVTGAILVVLLGIGTVWVSTRLSDIVWWDRRVHLFFLASSTLLLLVALALQQTVVNYIVILLLWLDLVYSLQLKFPDS